MASRVFRATLISAIAALLSATAAAQQVVSARAGLIYYVEGAVFFDGVPARSLMGTRYPALKDGQLLSTAQGHAEILLGSGAALWAGRDSRIRMQDSRLDDTRVVVEAGAAMIEVKSIPEGNRIHVEMGDAVVDLIRPGLYRFDAELARARVYDGELLASESQGAVRARIDQEIRLSEKSAGGFDRGRPDEFHYWAAWRSYQLAGEARYEGDTWSLRGFYQDARRHSGFGIEFPANPGAARLQYLAASTASLVYYVRGGAVLAGGSGRSTQVRVPFRLTSENTFATQTGDWAEIFMGVGVVARLGENTTIRLLDSTPLDATVHLYQGKALLEVSKAAQGTRIRVALGESVTELMKPGLYEFDAGDGLLRVYGGEAETSAGGKKSRTREGQMSTLASPPSVKKFDTKQTDSLYQWGLERSLILARSNGGFMTQWERVGRLLRHPQFGSVEGRRR